MREASYSDALRTFSEALARYHRAINSHSSKGTWITCKEALNLILRGILILKGVSLPELDLVYIASIAMDKGLIDEKIFAELIDLNLKLNGYGEPSIAEFANTFMKLLSIAVTLDPYLNQQLNLFRY